MSNMDTTSTCDYSDPYSESFHPFLLFRIVLIKLAPAYAKHCNCQRKALQLPTQSFATANAKLCNRQRKALQPPTQSFATTNAKLCLTQAFI